MTQVELSLNSISNSLDNNDLDLPIALRKGKRQCTQYTLSHFVSYEKISPSNQAFLTLLNTVSIPKILFRALKIKKWRQAMRVEMETLKKNKAWEIVELLRGKSPVGCKLVYTIKCESNRLPERYKCSLWSGLP